MRGSVTGAAMLGAVLGAASVGAAGEAAAGGAVRRPHVEHHHKRPCAHRPRELFYDEPYVYIRYYNRPRCGWVFDLYGRNRWLCRTW